MNKHFKKVLTVLKTKAKQLGFSYQELKSVAAKIADNLELEDDASDEDVNSAIENAVDDAMEFLSVSQSAAQRAIANYKAKHNVSDDDDDDVDGGEGDDDDTNNDGNGKKGKKNRQQRQSSKSDEDTDDSNSTPAWAKSLTDAIKSLGDKVSSLERGKVSDGRRIKLQELLKDTGKFGERKLKDFDRIADTFKDDEEFDQYFDEVSEDLDAYNQERADAGLSKLGKPGAGSPHNKGGDEPEKPAELTDEELDALADQL
jgi:hypothetical protein